MFMENAVIFGMVKGLHDLATAIWVGGLIHMSATIPPSFKDTGDEVVKRQILMTLQSKLSLLVYASIAVLVILAFWNLGIPSRFSDFSA